MASQFISSYCLNDAKLTDLVSLLSIEMFIRDAGWGDLLGDCETSSCDYAFERFQSHRTDDGGYARVPGAASGSIFHTFLVLLAYDMAAKEVPDRENVIKFILGRQKEDGGFVEVRVARRGGANPTAAALYSLMLLAHKQPPVFETGARFLAGLQSPTGGLLANPRAPMPDLLSSFTGFLCLKDMGLAHMLNQDRLRAFVKDLELPSGGFRGGHWDDQADAEYTFYGLGALALLEEKNSKNAIKNEQQCEYFTP